MSLIQQLLTEGKKDVMVNKIGLPDQLADLIISNFPKKYVMWVANNVMATALSAQYQVEIKSRSDYQSAKSKYKKGYRKDGVDRFLHGNIARSFINKDHIHTKYQVIIRNIVQDNNMPNINLKELWTFEDVANITTRYTLVIDYLEGATPTPNLSSMSWDEAVRQAEEWHEQLKVTGNKLDIQEGQVIVKEYDDGYYWLDLRDNNCQLEGGSMGHCGNTGADTLLSLRDAKGEPHVTVAYDFNNVYRQMKGKGNKKPIEKYHPYILDLFTEQQQVDDEIRHDYYIDYYDPEYEPKDDFNIFDLNKKLFNELRDKVVLDDEFIESQIKYVQLSDLIKKTNWDHTRINLDREDVLKLENEYTKGDRTYWVEIILERAQDNELHEIIENDDFSDELKKELNMDIFNNDLIYTHGSGLGSTRVRTDQSNKNDKRALIPYIHANRKIYIINFSQGAGLLDLIYGE